MKTETKCAICNNTGMVTCFSQKRGKYKSPCIHCDTLKEKKQGGVAMKLGTRIYSAFIRPSRRQVKCPICGGTGTLKYIHHDKSVNKAECHSCYGHDVYEDGPIEIKFEPGIINSMALDQGGSIEYTAGGINIYNRPLQYFNSTSASPGSEVLVLVISTSKKMLESKCVAEAKKMAEQISVGNTITKEKVVRRHAASIKKLMR